MTPQVLIHLVMSQTTVLIARLSTAGGMRAPLGDIASKVFLELSTAIEAQGVPRKLVADMFGMVLRGYQKKVQRLEESETQQGATLWQAVLEYLHDNGSRSRRDIEERFAQDDKLSVAAVLNDLVSCGLVFRAGVADMARYRAAESGDVLEQAKDGGADALVPLVLLLVYRHPGITIAELGEQVELPIEDLNAAVSALVEEGSISQSQDGKLSASKLTIPVGSDQGWEAAVFDHFSAVASAIGAKVEASQLKSEPDDDLGGGTLSFDVDPSHPHHDEVMGLLKRTRAEVNYLWTRVHAWNEEHPQPKPESKRVTFYFGQSYLSLTEGAE